MMEYEGVASLLQDEPGFRTSQDKSKPLSVTQLTYAIKTALEEPLSAICVRGEVSNFRPAASGHVYFSLKDAQSCISVALFKWGSRKVSFTLKDGLQVIIFGKVSVYGPRGTYQIVADQVEPDGIGALALAYEELKERLYKEGLFDPSVKRPLPRFPHKVVLITSATGAVIADMLKILHRRAPHIKVLLIPVAVQGEGAAEGLIRACETANQFSLGEVIVVARGGGSVEDLWCFNHERLARTLRASRIPVISAVGHEVDFTISDFVADVRAATPSAAAEILSQHWVEAHDRLVQSRSRLAFVMHTLVLQNKRAYQHALSKLMSPFKRAQDQIREKAQRLDESLNRLQHMWGWIMQSQTQALAQKVEALRGLSPLQVLTRGYVFVRTQSGLVVRAAKELQSGAVVEIVFHDGYKQVEVLND